MLNHFVLLNFLEPFNNDWLSEFDWQVEWEENCFRVATMSLGSYCSLKANFSVVSNISGPPETESSRLLNLSFRAKTTSQFQQSYQLLDELGRGGYGFVYRCVSRFTRRVCAVKFNIDPNSVNCMKREYNIISEICQKTGHPNIVNVLDSICDDRIMYNIFELATGGDLYLDLDEKVRHWIIMFDDNRTWFRVTTRLQ